MNLIGNKIKLKSIEEYIDIFIEILNKEKNSGE